MRSFALIAITAILFVAAPFALTRDDTHSQTPPTATPTCTQHAYRTVTPMPTNTPPGTGPATYTPSPTAYAECALTTDPADSSGGGPYDFLTIPPWRVDADDNNVAAASDAQVVFAGFKSGPQPPTFTPTFTVTLTPTSTPVPTATNTPTATATGQSLEEFAIANRGVTNDPGPGVPPHELVLSEPMHSNYSWGQHATPDEDSISGSHSINLWINVLRQAGQGATTRRFNIKRLYGYLHNATGWHLIYDGNLSGQWLSVSNADTSGGYHDAIPTTESDGSLSFALPNPPEALHMSQNAPGLAFTGGSDAVAVIVEARLIGSGSASWGIAPGADFRPTDGSSVEDQSCWGHLIALTSTFRTTTCLSSSLTDAQIRATNPPF